MEKFVINKVKALKSDPNIEKSKSNFYSVIIPILLSQELFKKNKDIRELTDLFKLEQPLKEYLFRCRTNVVAKIIREIYKWDSSQLKYNMQVLKKYISKNEERLLKDDLEFNSKVYVQSKKTHDEETIQSEEILDKETMEILKQINKYRRKNNNE